MLTFGRYMWSCKVGILQVQMHSFTLHPEINCDFQHQDVFHFKNGWIAKGLISHVNHLNMGVSKNSDIPKWMVYNPIKMDDLGGDFPHYFRKHPYFGASKYETQHLKHQVCHLTPDPGPSLSVSSPERLPWPQVCSSWLVNLPPPPQSRNKGFVRP